MSIPSTKPFFVRVKCQLGMTYTVALAIMDKIEETTAVYSTAGKYDLLVKFEIPMEQGFGQFVNATLHKIEGVVDTNTIIVFSAFARDTNNDDAARLTE
jgi:DNA-binding Lrp family transcriptional regulator